MKTAIEWLEEKLKESLGEDFDPVRGYFVMAKEMEAEQIIDAYQSDRFPCSEQDAVTYYIETYVGKI
jgi:Leu/Phe-tRNA-protein transferase